MGGKPFLRLSQEDSDDIGFVVACLFHEALSIAELRKWVERVIQLCDDPPAYLFDLVDFDGYMADIYAVIGFTPVWRRVEGEEHALWGIALRRGTTPYECNITEAAAERAITEHPQVLARFTHMFPFLSVSRR